MKTLLLLTSLCWGLLATTPVDIWEIMGQLKFKIHFDDEIDDVVFEPIATPAIQALEGKYIVIKGFNIDYLELEAHNPRVLFISKYYAPASSCTQPSTLTILQISTTDPLQLSEGKAYTIRGKFHLNTTNLIKHPFQLYEAECLDCP
ncbi:MAG: hypothetical protein AB8E82_20995 [Aureispira sp.]